ncbi:hypothetical protein B0I35DRAFT_345347 [Stachybotrys elegans]|uniref:Guanine deaminase n=1 Tax=Stachybotrys elegans TaxID=80388 RepID=A0A8K0T6E6_9HYPO|nr:hypothetical protein B0I35DRAFT_345347 [Stachybotrys elegans]
MPERGNLLLLGTFIHCKSVQELEYIHNAAVAVDGNGKIVGIERDHQDVEQAKGALLKSLAWSASDVEIHACKPGQFFFPGFIDTHIHASQYPNAGIFGKSTLLDWLETYTFPLESSLKDLAKARRVYTACVRRTLAHGTTMASYFATIDVDATNLLADICLDLGQRAFIGRVCMDNHDISPEYYRDESTEKSLEATLKTVEHIRSIDPTFDMVSPVLTPRFAPTCSAELMTGLSVIQRDMGLPVQTHVSENKKEIELVAQLFPDSKSYTDVYDECGLLTDRTILAHAIHLSEEEASTIARRGSKVSHCPCSNSALTSGVARVRWLWDKGIDVGLGTDMSGGYSPSILEAARQAVLVSRHLAIGLGASAETTPEELERSQLMPEEVLYLGTRGGARCVGLEKRVGGFEVGMDWDAQLIGLGSVDAAGMSEDDEHGNLEVFGWEKWEDIVPKWVYTGDDRNTKKVWVKGRLVHSRA